ncbi:MAG: L-amino acid dehydrogenase [Chroococcopsis gigantea SAG 12.99]|jgi:monoamine oxidase|nr:flavin monoamine oxidase family protein [Chlorogloea purpurea SAG 13.99]MDV2998937.1 L-amino acid dehydrogenase [Chroococcopsis gigantea SAG 12.99]
MLEMNTIVYDCIVIGAGLAGLITARDLKRAGLEVLVLEARDRIGGRMVGEYLPSGQWIDKGGQWVGPTQDRFLALVDEYGIRRFTSPSEGKKVLFFGGKRYEFDGFFQGFHEGEAPGVRGEEWNDALEAWQRFEALCSTLPPGPPYANRDLDNRTFAQWIEENTVTAFARWYFAYMCRAVGYLGPAEPHEVSLLHVLRGHKSASQAEHPEAQLLHGGAGQIPGKIAAELGGIIRVGEPVVRVSQESESLTVQTLKGSYQGKFAVVAMTPHLAGKIIYEPPMPPHRQQLTQRVPMGCCAKILVSYDRPFWREKGFAGIGLGNCQTLELCADSSDPETGVGVIATFVVGDRYQGWRPLPDDARRLAVLSDLSLFFGESALSPSTYHEVDWPAEEWTGGGYAAFMPPGVWTRYGTSLNAPVGRIHWAGTEMADRWAGFFDGAVRTGEAVAEKIKNLL